MVIHWDTTLKNRVQGKFILFKNSILTKLISSDCKFLSSNKSLTILNLKQLLSLFLNLVILHLACEWFRFF